MKPCYRKIVSTALLLCAVLCAFYLRADGDARRMTVPVQRVFAVVPTQSPAPNGAAAYRAERDGQRARETASLEALAAGGDARAAEELFALVSRAEMELAVEQAVRALGRGEAVCALRDGAAAICVPGTLTEAEAQTIIEICARLTGLSAENVFILDECGNL